MVLLVFMEGPQMPRTYAITTSRPARMVQMVQQTHNTPPAPVQIQNSPVRHQRPALARPALTRLTRPQSTPSPVRHAAPRMLATSTPYAVRQPRPRGPQQFAVPVPRQTIVQMPAPVTPTGTQTQNPSPIRMQQPSLVRTPSPAQQKTVVTEVAAAKQGNSFGVDLEDSISAAKIVKLAPTSEQNVEQLINNTISDADKRVALTSGQVISLAEFKHIQQQQQAGRGQPQPQPQQQPMPKVIRGATAARPRARLPFVGQTGVRPAIRAHLQQNAAPRQTAPILQQQQQPQIHSPPPLQQAQQSPEQQIIDREQQRESARMLVILQNGEQRLITFTLPKESCTVQELLEQVQVPFTPDTNIQCIPNPGVNIDYLVTVGVQFTEPASEIVSAAENTLQQKQMQLQQQQQQQQQAASPISSPNAVQQSQSQQQAKTTPPAIQQKPADPPPKYIANQLAVCSVCGYTGINHAQCQRCRRIFQEEPKKVAIATTKQKTAPTTAPPPLVSSAPNATSTPTNTSAITASEQKKRSLEAIQKKFQITTAAAEAIKYVHFPQILSHTHIYTHILEHKYNSYMICVYFT